jgi:hypothetical protein|tara:strand:+ start:4221 stop:4469 length:249 start_codon:yes stop_codon:yes gene_type:complete
MFRPRDESAEAQIDRATIQRSKEILQIYQDEGIVENVYTIEGGGSAFIINAPTRELLEHGLSNHPIAAITRCEIFEIETKQL